MNIPTLMNHISIVLCLPLNIFAIVRISLKIIKTQVFHRYEQCCWALLLAAVLTHWHPSFDLLCFHSLYTYSTARCRINNWMTYQSHWSRESVLFICLSKDLIGNQCMVSFIFFIDWPQHVFVCVCVCITHGIVPLIFRALFRGEEERDTMLSCWRVPGLCSSGGLGCLIHHGGPPFV